MTSLKRFVPGGIKAAIWRLASKHLHLDWLLASGYRVKIASYADWCIYNDVFVEGEYDVAIDSALNAFRGSGHFQVVDLGANVGFFALRVLDRIKRVGSTATRVDVLCVEASHSLERELKDRLDCRGDSGVSIKIVHGLVGERTGYGRLEFAPSQIMNRVYEGSGGAGRDVSYVDVESALPGVERIHLLKCDIEGSEAAFIRSYPTLLRRTEVAVFEFHEPACSFQDGTEAVMREGFSKSTILRDQGTAQTVLFER